MKIVFMGTPEYAVPSLRQLIAHHDVVAVCTQPDRRAGRGHKLQMSPVKALALEAGITVLQPETLRIKKAPVGDAEIQSNKEAKEIRSYLANLEADIFVVAAYGIILPKAVLDIPRLGSINVHASLLPKYRGASPIHSAIKNGDTVTGITIMYMDVGIDTGDMILHRELTIDPDERTPSLHDRMAELGGECIIEAIAMFEAGTATRMPQDDSISSYAPMIKKTDGHIRWDWPTDRIVNLIRAFDPWPGAYSLYKNDVIKIWRLEKVGMIEDAVPGMVLAVDAGRGFLVKTGDGGAWIAEVQAAGKKRMTAKDYLLGHEVRVGEILG
ncbi:MAG: methionyl-tRNA formyltransferase [Defluviitaleaceae bacterium]|nr:methionyl-tRNA formyltransferase [Defluviitaleaceae bacterium]